MLDIALAFSYISGHIDVLLSMFIVKNISYVCLRMLHMPMYVNVRAQLRSQPMAISQLRMD